MIIPIFIFPFSPTQMSKASLSTIIEKKSYSIFKKFFLTSVVPTDIPKPAQLYIHEIFEKSADVDGLMNEFFNSLLPLNKENVLKHPISHAHRLERI